MPNTTRTAPLHRLLAVGGGLLGVAALAGCSQAAATSPSSSDPSVGSSSSSSAAAPAASGSASALKDGTYEATGDYQSPGGPAAVDVKVTLKSGVISAVQVVPKAQNGTARQYESQFASGIGGVAIGKPIEGLQVGAVSGSSLTGQGFTRALQAIEEKAAA